MEPPTTRALDELAETLWSERHLVEFLLFKLVSARLLLAANESRFVAPAFEEVDRAVGALRTAEVRRDAAVRSVAAAWGVPAEDLTLPRLAALAPAPYGTMFREHHRAFHGLTDEVERTAKHNAQLAGGSLNHVRDSLARISGGADAGTQYDTYGRRRDDHRPLRLDQVL